MVVVVAGTTLSVSEVTRGTEPEDEVVEVDVTANSTASDVSWESESEGEPFASAADSATSEVVVAVSSYVIVAAPASAADVDMAESLSFPPSD